MKQKIDYLTTDPTSTEMKTVFDAKTNTSNGYIKNTWADGHVQVVKIVDDKLIDITKLYHRSYTILLVGAVIFVATMVVGLFVEEGGGDDVDCRSRCGGVFRDLDVDFGAFRLGDCAP